MSFLFWIIMIFFWLANPFSTLLTNAPHLSAYLIPFLILIAFESTKSEGNYCHELILYNFCLLSMKTSTLVETNHLETFQEFGNKIWLSRFLVICSRCENLILIQFYLQILNDQMLKPYI